jgi:hypothetical protein
VAPVHETRAQQQVFRGIAADGHLRKKDQVGTHIAGAGNILVYTFEVAGHITDREILLGKGNSNHVDYQQADLPGVPGRLRA